MVTGRLKGRTAVITGGANGIGRASVELFAREGAKVVYLDIDEVAGRKLEHETKAAGLNCQFIAADVSQESDVLRAIGLAIQSLGHIDILFNHAGIILAKPFLDMNVSDWDQLMKHNARSVFLMCRHVIPGMLKRGSGVIINTSSTSARAVSPMETIYCASKAAMHQFCRAIAVEYRDSGIRCNLICPSFVRTKHATDELAQLRKYGIPASDDDVKAMQGRVCEPEEVASVALFLASDEASFMNGAEVFVDNTMTAV